MEEEKIVEDQHYNLIYRYPFEDKAEPKDKGGLFLSGKEAAHDLKFLRENKIKAVLTLTSASNPEYQEEDNIEHLMIDISDTTDYNIQKDFEQTYEFIDKHLRTGNILVHCEKGISRSPTIAIAYIMKKEKRILSNVIHQMRQIRSVVDPNGGFRYHLDKYSDTLRHAFAKEYDSHNQKKPIQHNENSRKLFAHQVNLNTILTNQNLQQQPINEISDQQQQIQQDNSNSNVSKTPEENLTQDTTTITTINNNNNLTTSENQ